ncbi:MAG: polysaccharide deacetylase family protein [Nanohaloarchaea archaeon]|nr:polysaccharide deacetylase family protein [Candidatus Nanohaloarchaea archaeon]
MYRNRKINVLVLSDKTDSFGLKIKDNEKYQFFSECIDYKGLDKSNEKIKGYIFKNKIDLILFSRNNMVKDRIDFGNLLHRLQIGYSSFSGIDDDEWDEQTRQCLSDFLKGNVKLNLKSNKRDDIKQNSKKTFNLIFDMEQLGGCRYGLPRILKILDRYGVKATFFVTDIINKTYTDVIPYLAWKGHEIGLHGYLHEYLQTMSKEDQTRHISKLKKEFKCEIEGVNFILRMNNDSICCFRENSVKYFLYPHINKRKIISIPCGNLKIKNKDMILVPVCVETYGKTFETIKNEIQFTEMKNKSISNNITILMHPFSDGSKSRIENTEKVIKFLIKDRCPETVYQTIQKGEHKETRDFNISISNKYLKTIYDMSKFNLKTL